MPFEADNLPRRVIEQQLENKYRAAIVNGLSRTSVYEATKYTELGIRKTESLRISRIAAEKANTILAFRALSVSQPIQPRFMLEMNAPGEKRYMYNAEVTITTSDGYLLSQRFMPWYSDTILTKEDVRTGIESIEITDKGTEINVNVGNITEAYRNTVY